MLKGVNWIAAIIAVVLMEALAMAWYGPLFGARWTAALGHDVPQDNMLMAAGVVNTLIVVLGLSWLNQKFGAASLGEAVKVAVTAWFFFAFTTQALEHLYMGMSLEFTLINMGYLLASFVLAGAVLSLVKFGRSAATAAA